MRIFTNELWDLALIISKVGVKIIDKENFSLLFKFLLAKILALKPQNQIIIYYKRLSLLKKSKNKSLEINKIYKLSLKY